MKKLIIIITALIVSTSIFAQGGFSGGVYFSPIISWFKPDVKHVESDAMRLNFGFGLAGDFGVSDNFAFSTGLRMSNTGGSLKYLDSIPVFNTSDETHSLTYGSIIKYKTQFIGIPVLFKGKTNEIAGMIYYLKAGFCPSFRYNAKGDVTVNSNDNIKDEIRGIYTSFEIGGGFEYVLGGNTRLVTELIFSNGLTDITKTKTWDAKNSKIRDKSDKVINNAISINVGIMF